MGSRWLVELADVLRGAGLVVVEVDGWQTRARGSGGYNSGLPSHVLTHHTASPPSSDGWPDVSYCTYHDDDAPLANLYLDRLGIVYVCAAGATNTNGSGHDPCGWTPDDSMNSHAVGIEAGNNGVGEAWPTSQQTAYVQMCSALCRAYAIPTGRVHSHFEWAPDRKTDPAGQSKYADGSARWNMAAFRADVAAFDPGGGHPPTPAPVKLEEEPMRIAAAASHYWVSNDIHCRKMVRADAEQLIARAKRDASKGVVLLDFRTGKVVDSIGDVGEISSSELGDLGSVVT